MLDLEFTDLLIFIQFVGFHSFLDIIVLTVTCQAELGI